MLLRCSSFRNSHPNRSSLILQPYSPRPTRQLFGGSQPIPPNCRENSTNPTDSCLISAHVSVNIHTWVQIYFDSKCHNHMTSQQVLPERCKCPFMCLPSLSGCDSIFNFNLSLDGRDLEVKKFLAITQNFSRFFSGHHVSQSSLSSKITDCQHTFGHS